MAELGGTGADLGGGGTTLSQDIQDALNGAAAPSAANVFATMADAGGTTFYTGDSTFGAGRVGTVTDSVTFRKGISTVAGTAHMINIVSDVDGNYLSIENASRVGFEQVFMVNEVANVTEMSVLSRGGDAKFSVLKDAANGLTFETDGAAATFRQVGAITTLEFDFTAIIPFSVGGFTVGNGSRPIGDTYLKTGGYNYIQTQSGSANIEFQLGNTRDDGINNKSSFYLTSTVDYTTSHYLSGGIATKTYFTFGAKGRLGINLGGSPALAVSPTAMIELKGTGATSASSQLKLANSAGTPSLQVFDDNRIAVGNVITQVGQVQIKGSDSAAGTHALYIETAGNLTTMKVDNNQRVGIGAGHTAASTIDATLDVKHTAGVGILSEATTTNIDATITALQSGSNTKNAVFEAQNSNAVKYQLISYGEAAPVNAGLGGARWTAGDFSFFFGNNERVKVWGNGDLELLNQARGIILSDRTTGTRTRFFVDNGIWQQENA